MKMGKYMVKGEISEMKMGKYMVKGGEDDEC